MAPESVLENVFPKEKPEGLIILGAQEASRVLKAEVTEKLMKYEVFAFSLKLEA